MICSQDGFLFIICYKIVSKKNRWSFLRAEMIGKSNYSTDPSGGDYRFFSSFQFQLDVIYPRCPMLFFFGMNPDNVRVFWLRFSLKHSIGLFMQNRGNRFVKSPRGPCFGQMICKNCVPRGKVSPGRVQFERRVHSPFRNRSLNTIKRLSKGRWKLRRLSLHASKRVRWMECTKFLKFCNNSATLKMRELCVAAFSVKMLLNPVKSYITSILLKIK